MARTLQGTVASDKGQKTIVVAVQTAKTHPVYKKKYTVTKRYAAHDEKSEAAAGDLVEIVECRPVSATKRFKLSRVVQKAGVVHTTEADASAVEAVTKTKKDEETTE